MPEAAEDAALAFLTSSRTLIAVVGPTASGKTALALALARKLRGEIVSCDSRQIFKGLTVGTDKPQGTWTAGTGDGGVGPDRSDTPGSAVGRQFPVRATPSGAQQGTGKVFLVQGIPYHLVDFLEPTEAFNAGEYAKRAQGVIADIEARGGRPIVAGGTGLWLKALLGGLDPLPPADPALRSRLEKEGRAALHARLAKADPAAAEMIPEGNIQRLVRAVELLELTGKPPTELWSKKKAETPHVCVGVDWPKEALERRIRARAASAFPAMRDEARALIDAGVPADAPGLRSLGYPEAIAWLEGRLGEEEAREEYVRAVLRYAKRQRTWFRNQHDVRWLTPGKGDPAVWAEEAVSWLNA